MTKEQQLRRALESLVSGVQDIEKHWPSVTERAHAEMGPLNEMIGFLFATLSLAQQALQQPETFRQVTVVNVRRGGRVSIGAAVADAIFKLPANARVLAVIPVLLAPFATNKLEVEEATIYVEES
jgi:hypothetical protein